MKLEGVHHVTAITADAPRNVEFYAGLLGLRMVKKTVNQDDPTVYHLFYADEQGDPGSDITFFEYPGARQGRAGAGMVHTVRWRVASEDALDFWQKRLDNHVLSRQDGRLTFVDPEGLRHELAVQGFDGVRAFSADPERSRDFLEQTLEFERGEGDSWEARGKRRGGLYEYDAAPEGPGIGGAGTVHHVAWASPPEEHEPWRERVAAAGAHVTPIIDRFYFKSIYFREPSGVLFEIATIGPGFATDEPIEHLGQRLSLPPAFEHLRSEVEPILTPLPNPREPATAR